MCDRSGTLIDLILCYFDVLRCLSGVIETDISNHYHIFLLPRFDHERAKPLFVPKTRVDDQSLRESLCAASSDILHCIDVSDMYDCFFFNTVTKWMKTTHPHSRKDYDQCFPRYHAMYWHSCAQKITGIASANKIKTTLIIETSIKA